VNKERLGVRKCGVGLWIAHGSVIDLPIN